MMGRSAINMVGLDSLDVKSGDEDDDNEEVKENGDNEDNDNDNDEEKDENEEDEDDSADKEKELNLQESKMAVVTDFLHKLFPGKSIFTGNRNIVETVVDNHDYFKMLGGSKVSKSRTIQFLEVIILVLTCIFVNTVFFGIYYPPSSCASMTTEVRKSTEIFLLHPSLYSIFEAFLIPKTFSKTYSKTYSKIFLKCF